MIHCLSCFLSVLSVLLNEKVIDVNGKNNTGWAPLHKIASVNDSHDSDKCTTLLVKNGADIEAKDLHGNTPVSIPSHIKIILTRMRQVSRCTATQP